MRTFKLGLCLVAAAVLFAGARPAQGADVVASYLLNGDPNDSSGNDYHGVVSGGVTFVADATRGQVASFDGVNGSIDVSASGFSIVENGVDGAQFSVSFWIKPTFLDTISPTGNGIADNMIVMGGTDHGVIELVGDGCWNNFNNAKGGVGLNSGGGGGTAGIVPGINLYDGNWHNVVVQWVDPDGTTAGNVQADGEIYIDGVFYTDKNSQGYSGNGNIGKMVLGGPCVWSNGGAANKYYTGLLSGVVFWDSPLTATEIIDEIIDPADDTAYTWTCPTAGDGLWATTGNWSTTGTPPPDNANQAAVVVGDTDTKGAIDLGATGYSIHNITFNGNVDVTVSGSAGLSFGEAGRHSSDIIVNHGSVTTQASEIACPVTINNTMNVMVADANDQITISGAIGGAGGLNVLAGNQGTLALGSANTFTGETSIGGGTLKLGNAQALQNSTVVTSSTGGTLDVNGISATLGGLTGDGDVVLGATTLTIGGNNADATYSGALSGTGAGLTKAGSGTQTLTGASSYTGVTTVSSGTLSAGSLAEGGAASPIGAAGSDAANLVLGNNTTLLYTGTGSSTDRLFTLAGNVTIDNRGSGELSFTNTGAMAFGTADESRKLTFRRETGTVTTIAAAIGDNGTGVVSVSAGIMNQRVYGTTVLTGTNTYTGDTTVIYGALRADDGVGLPTDSKLVFNCNQYEQDAAVLETSGTFTRDIGNAAGKVYWQYNTGRSGGGFAAHGGDLTVTLNGGAPIDWSAADGFNGTALALGSRTATHKVELTNDLVLNGSRTIALFGNDAVGADNAVLSGDISDGSSASGLTFRTAGDTNVYLTGNNSYTGTVSLSGSNAGLLNVVVTDPGGLGGSVNISGGMLTLAADADTNWGRNFEMGSNWQMYVNVDRAPGGSGSGGTHTIGDLYINAGGGTSGAFRFQGDNGYGLTVGNVTCIKRNPSIYNTMPGTLTFAGYNGTWSGTGNGSLNIYGTGTTVFEGNVAGTAASSTYDLYKNDGGTLILNGTCTYDGPTKVYGGTLVVNGTIQNSDVTIQNSGCALGGDGSVKSLVMNGNTIFNWEFDGSGNTMDIIGGNLTLNNGWKINLIDLGDDPYINEEYDLFTYSGTCTLGTFSYNADLAPDWDVSGLSIVDDGLGRVYITGVGQAGSPVTPGDTNDDGVVDAADFITVKRNFGTTTGGGASAGDFDETGTVDWADLNVLTSNFGAGGPAPATTPEPATLGLLALGALAIVRRRRK